MELMRNVLTGVALASISCGSALAAGGSALRNFHQVSDELYRSGTLVSDAAVGELENVGIKTIISLEEYGGNRAKAATEASWAHAHGMEHVWYPMTSSSAPTLAEINHVLELIHDAEPPVLLHCFHGSDRTGIMVGAYRIRVQGWSVADAIAELRDPQYRHARNLYYWDDILNEVE